MPSVGTVGGTIAVSILCVALVYACHHKETHKVAPPPPAPVVHVAPKAVSTPFHCKIFHCATAPLPKAKPVVVPKAAPAPAPVPKAAPTPAKPADFCALNAWRLRRSAATPEHWLAPRNSTTRLRRSQPYRSA